MSIILIFNIVGGGDCGRTLPLLPSLALAYVKLSLKAELTLIFVIFKPCSVNVDNVTLYEYSRTQIESQPKVFGMMQENHIFSKKMEEDLYF